MKPLYDWHAEQALKRFNRQLRREAFRLIALDWWPLAAFAAGMALYIWWPR